MSPPGCEHWNTEKNLVTFLKERNSRVIKFSFDFKCHREKTTTVKGEVCNSWSKLYNDEPTPVEAPLPCGFVVVEKKDGKSEERRRVEEEEGGGGRGVGIRSVLKPGRAGTGGTVGPYRSGPETRGPAKVPWVHSLYGVLFYLDLLHRDTTSSGTFRPLFPVYLVTCFLSSSATRGLLPAD